VELLIDTKAIDNIGNRVAKIDSKTMTKVGQTIKSDLLFWFRNEESPDGKKWAKLKKSTVKSKIRKSGVVRKLQDTGNLKKSLNFRAGRDKVEIGYGVKYSVFHQLGTKVMAARKILPTDSSEIDMEEIEKIILGDINV